MGCAYQPLEQRAQKHPTSRRGDPGPAELMELEQGRGMAGPTIQTMENATPIIASTAPARAEFSGRGRGLAGGPGSRLGADSASGPRAHHSTSGV